MTEVLLTSGSVPALVAALDLASVGIRVRIASDVVPEVPYGPVTDPEGVVAALLSELAAPIAEGGRPAPELEAALSAPAPLLLRSRDGGWTPQPQPAVWGIPGVPVSYECMSLLGTSAAMRAYLDRVKPVLTIGKEDNLAKLVTSRMGAKVLKVGVEPVVFERYGVTPDAVSVGFVAPGLNEALTRTGSLSGAVLEYAGRHVARETTVRPSAGWDTLAKHLLDRLELYGADRLPDALGRFSFDEHAKTWHSVSASGDTYVFDGVVTSAANAESAGMHEASNAPKIGQNRVYAEIGIQSMPGDSGLDDTAETLELAEDLQGNRWSIRTRVDEFGERAAELRSEAFRADERTVEMAEILAVLESAKYETKGDLRSMRTEPLPFSSRNERENTLAAVSAWHVSHPEIILAGLEEYRGDLAVALEGVRQESVVIRRRLMGITE